MKSLQFFSFCLFLLGCHCSPQEVTLYSSTGCTGSSVYINGDVPDLAAVGFNDIANSALKNGIWIFYENGNYNAVGGQTLLFWSINYCSDFDPEERNMVSSLRYAGKQDSLNGETFSLYEGYFFTGQEYWSDTDNADLGDFNDRATSLMITGQSPWTIYSDNGFGGMPLCFYPDTYIEAGFERIDLGYFADLAMYGFDKAVSSVAKGCFGKNIVRLSHPANKSTSSHAGMVMNKQ
ncbi:hypothetical protein SK128_010488 [Halocaridina rubra]|uniref:Beta/gamma crystallin 'Greek key' domain-containing protein n=1 Tax=Halocaridina rubra TaxID=373956 RepID=A0AAN8XGP6_HALRR